MEKIIADLLPLASSWVNTLISIALPIKKAYALNKEETLQMLLFIRDRNNWAGKRDFVRNALLIIKRIDEETFNKVLLDFLLIWRWDDLFFCEEIINKSVIDLIANHLTNGDTLLKKWLPREWSNPIVARKIARWLGFTMKEYRLSTKQTEWEFVNTLFRPIASYYINI